MAAPPLPTFADVVRGARQIEDTDPTFVSMAAAANRALDAARAGANAGPTTAQAGDALMPSGFYASEGKPSGGSFWGDIGGALKSLGSTALKALSVPGSATVTTLSNLGHVIGGDTEHMQPWSDVVAPFEGRSAGADALKSYGVTNPEALKWGGMGIDIGVDPLLPVGLTKIPKTIVDVTEALKGLNAVDKTAEVGSDVSKIAHGPMTAVGETPKAPIPLMATEGLPRSGEVKLAQSGTKLLTPKYGKLAERPDMPLLKDTKIEIGKGPYRPRGERIPHSPQYKGPLPTVKEQLPLLGGKLTRPDMPLVGEDIPLMGGHLAPRPNMPLVGEDLKLFGKNVPKDTTLEDAIGAGPEPLPHMYGDAAEEPAVEQIVQGHVPEEGLNRFGMPTPKMMAGKLRTLRESHVANANLEHTLGIKYLGKTFDTGLKVPARSLVIGSKAGDVKKALDSRFRLHPLAQIARRLQVTSDVTKRGLPTSIEESIGRMQKTLGLSPEDAKQLGTFLIARDASPELGNSIKQYLRSSGRWKPGMDAAVQQFDRTHADMSALRGFEPGPESNYFRQGRSRETADALKQHFGDSNIQLMRMARGGQQIGDATESRVFEHGFAGTTADAFAKRLAGEAGLSPQEASDLRDIISTHFERAEQPGFAEEPVTYEHAGAPGIHYQPELDAFDLFSRSNQGFMSERLDNELENLMDETGLGGNLRQSAKDLISKSADTRTLPGSIKGSAMGARAQKATSQLKQMFTTDMPAHYMRKVVGDWMNSFVNGNYRHFFSGPMFHGKYMKIVQGDEHALNAMYDVGEGRQVSGWQLMAEAQFSGFGFHTSQVAQEINAMRDLRKAANNPISKYRSFMRGLNTDRDNAQLLRTWTKHLQGGDDMFTAAAKTLRVHFDYGQMTHFEKLWMRNLMLFYSWVRKNTALHIGGMATRPGLYSASGHIEADRPKLPNEAPYAALQGLLPIPGLGNVGFNSPIGDMENQLNLGNLRENTLGAMNPLLTTPASLLLNQDVGSGKTIAQYSGQKTPSIWAQILPFLGGTAAGHAHGVAAPAIDSRVAEILNNFTPPILGTLDSLAGPNHPELNKTESLLGALTGIKPQQDEPLRNASIAYSNLKHQLADLKNRVRYNQAP